eukprot:559982-Amphidinium_carterae.1
MSLSTFMASSNTSSFMTCVTAKYSPEHSAAIVIQSASALSRWALSSCPSFAVLLSTLLLFLSVGLMSLGSMIAGSALRTSTR